MFTVRKVNARNRDRDPVVLFLSAVGLMISVGLVVVGVPAVIGVLFAPFSMFNIVQKCGAPVLLAGTIYIAIEAYRACRQEFRGTN